MKKAVLGIVLLFLVCNIYSQPLNYKTNQSEHSNEFTVNQSEIINLQLLGDTTQNELASMQKPTMFDLKRNIGYLNTYTGIPLFTYGRIFPIEKHVGISLSIGSLFVFLAGEVNLLFGGPKHLFEIGSGLIYWPIEGPNLIFNLGYRYQAKKGFMVRAGLHYVGDDVWETPLTPGIGIGYAF